MKNWIFLAVSIFGEVIATSALKSSHGFTRLVPSVVVVAGYGLAFYFLSLAQVHSGRYCLRCMGWAWHRACGSYCLDFPWPKTRLLGVHWHGTYRQWRRRSKPAIQGQRTLTGLASNNSFKPTPLRGAA